MKASGAVIRILEIDGTRRQVVRSDVLSKGGNGRMRKRKEKSARCVTYNCSQ